MKKNLMQVFHLTPNGSLSHFWREPIHIASLFATLRFSQDTFSQQSSNTNEALVESKFDQTTVASSANCNSLDSKSFIFIRLIERFSFECRKVIGFAINTLRDWLKKLAPLFHPIRSKTKTNRNSLAHVFPRFASATCNYHEF